MNENNKMKKILLINIVVIFIFTAGLAHAVGGIVGTPHDFSSLPGGDPQGRICIFCHTPHHSFQVGNYYPLWSREIQEIPYSIYDHGNGPTTGNHALNAVQSSIPDPQSLMCLSCHDGSFAMNISYIGENQDLSNHHPVSFDYEAVALLDYEIAPSDTSVLPGLTIKDILSSDGTTMTCSTCHDAHNIVAQGESFLFVNNSRSAFCLVCHLK